MILSYCMVFVSDMQRSIAFYRDVMGLPVKLESPEWSEFMTEGVTFALHRAASSAVRQAEDDAAGACRPGFAVEDLEAFHHKAQRAGVVCVREPHEVFGVRMARYRDPDGLVVTVSGQRSAR